MLLERFPIKKKLCKKQPETRWKDGLYWWDGLGWYKRPNHNLKRNREKYLSSSGLKMASSIAVLSSCGVVSNILDYIIEVILLLDAATAVKFAKISLYYFKK